MPPRTERASVWSQMELHPLPRHAWMNFQADTRSSKDAVFSLPAMRRRLSLPFEPAKLPQLAGLPTRLTSAAVSCRASSTAMKREATTSQGGQDCNGREK